MEESNGNDEGEAVEVWDIGSAVRCGQFVNFLCYYVFKNASQFKFRGCLLFSVK